MKAKTEQWYPCRCTDCPKFDGRYCNYDKKNPIEPSAPHDDGLCNVRKPDGGFKPRHRKKPVKKQTKYCDFESNNIDGHKCPFYTEVPAMNQEPGKVKMSRGCLVLAQVYKKAQNIRDCDNFEECPCAKWWWQK